MRKILLLLLVMLNVSYSFAQSVQQRQKELNKANKEFMKQLEKKYDLKGIYVRVEDDGYWYYSVYKKGDISGILNQKGEVIVPIKYRFIEYKKPLDEGFTVGVIEKDTVWHRANLGCFHAQAFRDKNKPSKYGIYRLDGTAMVEDLEANIGVYKYEGYVEYSVFDTKSSDPVCALYTQDGEIVIPMGYTFCEMKDKTCIIVQNRGKLTSGGSSMYGAIMLDGSLPPVPCQYSSVSYDRDNNQWMVTDPMTYEQSVYNPNRATTSEMKDKGVELFWSGKYDEVIDYYSKEGIDKPWAKFYSGASLFKKAEKMNLDLSLFLYNSKNRTLDDTKPYSGITWRQYFSGINFDLDLLKNMYITGYQLMDAYLQEDTTFTKEVKKFTYLNLNGRLQLLADDRAEFEPLWEKYLRENEAIVARQQAERQRVAQQNDILGQILGIFVQGLAQGLSNSGSNKSASYSGKSNHNTRVATNVSSASRSGFSGSSSSQSSQTQYRQCQKCRGTGEIFTTSTVATYGNDKKVVCSKCGQEHWLSIVHHHKKCNNCNGTGKVAK